jgi:hypothetical protein
MKPLLKRPVWRSAVAATLFLFGGPIAVRQILTRTETAGVGRTATPASCTAPQRTPALVIFPTA